MKRTTVAVIATLIALVVLAGTGSVGFTAAPNQQSEALDISVWLSETGSTDPVRRLDPGTTEAQVVIQSNLQSNDPMDFRAVVVDATGIQVYRSQTQSLETGELTTTVPVAGKDFFQSYASNLEDQKGELGTAIDTAISVMEEERGKQACADEPTDRIQTSRVIDRINQALGVRASTADLVSRLLGFDSLEETAQTDLTEARTALEAVSTEAAAAIDKLEVPDDAPTCSNVNAPDWEPDWDAVRADLDAMKSNADTSVTEIDSALAAVDLEMDRSFPTTAVADQCNQNTVQLRVADSEAPSDDFWFTVGTPGPAARLTNPEEPTSMGSLLARPTQIYATGVTVAGAAHSSQVQALVLDETCLPVSDATVNFSTPPGSPVTVGSAQVDTDQNGVANVTINATNQVGDGMASIDAQVDSVVATTNLTVIGPPAEGNVQLRLRGTQTETADPAFGRNSSTQVSAVIQDQNGNDVADGTSVHFTITPDDHSFQDDGQVTTADGEASATLFLGQQMGEYIIQVEAGGVTDSQDIRVVGPPDNVTVEADPRVLVTTSTSVDDRSSTLTVNVTDAQDPPAWAPDTTVVEFEFLNSEDIGLAYFQNLTQEAPGVWSRANLVGGETTATLVANREVDGEPLQGFHRLDIRVTASYSFGGEDRGSASEVVSVILQGELGESIFLPLIRK